MSIPDLSRARGRCTSVDLVQALRAGTVAAPDDTIGCTPVVDLACLWPGARVFARLESFNPTGSVNDRMAQAMIEDVRARGAASSNASRCAAAHRGA